MLQRIRDNASGPLAYVVVALIALVFGVWGIGSYFTPSSDPVVASVGHQDITRGQLQQAYDQRYEQLRRLAGDNFDPDMVPPEQLRRTALRGLLNSAVVDQYAQNTGYTISDGQLLAAIRNDQQFQAGGQFSGERYRALLARYGMTPARYEARLRDVLKRRALRDGIVDTAFAAPAEIDQIYRLANQKRRVRYLQFDPADYRDAVEVTDAEVQQYYNDNPQRFQRPERVKLDYVELSQANALPDYEPTEKTLRALYDENKTTLGTSEKRSGARIRVPIEGDDATARDTVQQLAGQLDKNPDLKSAAKAVGDTAQFGRIDASSRQDLPAAVGDALFAMKKSDGISSPVRAGDAWYLLRLDQITPAETPPFDAPKVQARLKAMAQTQNAAQAYSDKADRLESLAFEAPNDLKTLADELNLDIQHTGWITRAQGLSIGQYDAVRKAAFSDAVLKDKLNSTPVQLGSSRRVVLRVATRQKAETRPLDDVRDSIRKRLIAEKTSQKADEAARRALKKLRSGDSELDALAADGGPSLKSPGYIQRSGQSTDPRINEVVFAQPAPSEDRPQYDVTQTSNGMIVLVCVDKVRIGDESDEVRAQFADQQRQYIAKLEYAALRAYLRNTADIEIHEDRIN